MLATGLLFGLLALAAPPAEDDLESLLREPLQVGNVAQLVLHAADPRVSERWNTALRDPRPGVRAAAARAVAVVGARLALPVLQALAGEERDALASLEMRRALRILERTEPDTLAAGAGASLHTAGALWPELVAEVLRTYRCKPPDGGLAAAFMEYGRGGRARKVEMVDTLLPPACARAGRVLLALSLSPAAPEASPRALVALPLDPEWVACVAPRPSPRPASAMPDALAAFDADLLPTQRRRVGRQIREPRKTHQVAPRYPASAAAARRQGVVVLEMVISPTGCVGDMRVLQSAGLDLDFAAFNAVKEWRYTPTLLDGQAVPVTMTVTVTFKVR